MGWIGRLFFTKNQDKLMFWNGSGYPFAAACGFFSFNKTSTSRCKGMILRRRSTLSRPALRDGMIVLRSLWGKTVGNMDEYCSYPVDPVDHVK